MSCVIATPELVQGAAQDLAGIRSSLADATASVSGPTTGIAAAAQDEVSIAIASLFGNVGQEFQALSGQAQAFHTQFVNAMNASAGAYVSAELANAEQTLLGAVGQSFGAPTGAAAGAAAAAITLAQDFNGFGAMVAAPYQALVPTTVTNAQTVFGAFQQSLSTLAGGVSAEFSLLAASPATVFGNLETALQSVALVGANGNITSTVTQHTLGVIGEAMGGLLGPTAINDTHYQLWLGLQGSGFTPGTGLEADFVGALANFAASPLSGVLIGAMGPFISPGVALWNEAGTIFADLTGATPNPAAAFAALLDTPATVTNAFFNGATLNLDALAPVFSPFVSAGDNGGQTLTGLSFAFGGLFSPGQVAYGASGPMYNGTGGSLLNSLGMDFAFSPPDEDAGATLVINPSGVGPIAATANLIDIFGQELQGNLINSSAVGGFFSI